MTMEENSICGITKSSRKLTLDGSLITEEVISVWGNTLKEVHSIYLKEKNK